MSKVNVSFGVYGDVPPMTKEAVSAGLEYQRPRPDTSETALGRPKVPTIGDPVFVESVHQGDEWLE